MNPTYHPPPPSSALIPPSWLLSEAPPESSVLRVFTVVMVVIKYTVNAAAECHPVHTQLTETRPCVPSASFTRSGVLQLLTFFKFKIILKGMCFRPVQDMEAARQCD